MNLAYLTNIEDEEADPTLMNHNNIYSMMKEELREDFNAFKPITNIWWLTHILYNVHNVMKDQLGQRASDVDRIALYALQRLKDNVLHYTSAMDFLRAEVFEVSDTTDSTAL
ncbi:hypothetical protein CEXT_732441 [Caerostris extrusa]|uniref:Serine/threonine-protein kinase haspin C-terminal domain-containing protein n=1 Tax=Caerostris extrusa TaxID=172846 RepID=A0AAV4R231_CAEEX|nr:hypothetical protein CEXT_732441 [Caerostris extrusa]